MKLLSLTVALVLISCASVGHAAKSDCQLSWTPYPLHNVPGLTNHPEFTNEDACKKGCAAKEDCWNVDWNFVANTCWFGTDKVPTQNDNTQVNHYDLGCVVTPAPTTTTTTTPAPTTTAAPTYADCAEILKSFPASKSGKYSIKIPGTSALVSVWCDMDTACGG